jgi:hypothetical protein
MPHDSRAAFTVNQNDTSSSLSWKPDASKRAIGQRKLLPVCLPYYNDK